MISSSTCRCLLLKCLSASRPWAVGAVMLASISLWESGIATAENGDNYGLVLRDIDQYFEKIVMPAGGALADVHFIDLNRDQLLDVIGIYKKPASKQSKPKPAAQSLLVPFKPQQVLQRYQIRVYLQTAAHRFVQKADQPLPKGLSAVDLGNFAAGTGLVMLQGTQVQLWLWKQDRFVPADSKTLSGWPLLSPIDSLPRHYPLLAELNGDSYDELLIPTGGMSSILAVTKSGQLEQKAAFTHDMDGERRYSAGRNRWESFFTIPQYIPFNIDNQGWKDVGWYHSGKLDIFRLGVKGRLGRSKPLRFQFPKHLNLIRAQDVNKDGRVDLIFAGTNVSSSIFNAKGEILVYQARKGGSSTQNLDFVAAPDLAYRQDGLVFPFFLQPAPSHATDLVLIRVKLGVANIMRSILSRSISVRADWYPLKPNQHYPKKSKASQSYSVGISFGRDSHHPIVAFAHLNHDRYPDLLLSKGKERLLVHWGRANKLWSNTADASIQAQLPTRMQRLQVLNLDGDQRDDLAFIYSEQDAKHFEKINHQITVFLNRTPKTR